MNSNESNTRLMQYYGFSDMFVVFFVEKLEMMEKICVECAMRLNIQNKQFNSFRFEILTLVVLNVIAYIKIHK